MTYHGRKELQFYLQQTKTTLVKKIHQFEEKKKKK